MLAIKLAYKNLIGAGLRTWLNVIILSIAFVMIIWFKGMLDGWDQQAKHDSIEWEFGAGQFWNEKYDPYDPFTLTESHAAIPEEFQKEISENEIAPILITQGTIYPEGRMQSVLLKGILQSQNFLSLPTSKLDTVIQEIPAIIGRNMARNNHLEIGDALTLRWRDANGTFDANEILIVDIFDTDVPAVDGGQVWISLENLQEMMLLKGEATLLVVSDTEKEYSDNNNWSFKDRSFLLSDIDKIIQSKTAGGSIFYFILLMLAWLAIFDTQVLSIFRRQKEIGTYIAMGMTKGQVVWLFTVEGAFHSILAVLVGALYGVPFFIYQSVKGISFGMDGTDYGITMAETLFPLYTIGLVLTTITIVVLTTTFVSWLPARKISKMKPTEALKGKN